MDPVQPGQTTPTSDNGGMTPPAPTGDTGEAPTTTVPPTQAPTPAPTGTGDTSGTTTGGEGGQPGGGAPAGGTTPGM